jgi:hypothetical protein
MAGERTGLQKIGTYYPNAFVLEWLRVETYHLLPFGPVASQDRGLDCCVVYDHYIGAAS